MTNLPTSRCRLLLLVLACGGAIGCAADGAAVDDVDTDDADDPGEPVCGDGQIAGDEACDDGDANGDGPDAACRLDCQLNTCGDGVVDPGEACDGFNGDEPNDTCRTDCTARRCGDGIVDDLWGEACDDGNLGGGDGCAADCSSTEACGNLLLDLAVAETCDDGNLADADGCSATCELEPGGLELPASVLSFVTSLDGQATYTRTGSTIAPIGESTCSNALSEANVRYRTFTLNNAGPTPVRAWVTASYESGDAGQPADGYLYAYAAFDPLAPLDGCLAANDDHFFSDRSTIHPSVPAGGQVTVVVTEFSAGSAPGAILVQVDYVE